MGGSVRPTIVASGIEVKHREAPAMQLTPSILSALALAALMLAGCAGRPLMPTPNLYADTSTDPFREVPSELQSNLVRVLYLTDRQPESEDKGNLRYGYERSYSLAWGVATVALGRDTPWEDLVDASLTSKRKQRLEVELVSVDEKGRGPDTPIPFAIEGGFPRKDPAIVAQAQSVADTFHQELTRRLEFSRRKEVVFYIHGYNNTFEDAVTALAELSHFGGREAIPVAYTWPAGRPGWLRGYVYDRESSEFTVHHLKESIRMVSGWPEVERIHIVAHSRGTDIALSAVRELFIDAWARGISPKEEFRIENLVLIAPDLDTQVLDQRILGAHINAGVSKLVVYTSPDDKALGFAELLFSSPRGRVGKFNVSELTEAEKNIMERYAWNETINVINFSGESDRYGHSYFRTNPAVSSDLILLFKGIAPGSPSRPLKPLGFGFWEIPKSYPNN